MLRRQRDVTKRKKVEKEQCDRFGFTRAWGPILQFTSTAAPNSHSDAQKQKLYRKNIHGKVITQQSTKELKILQTGEFRP